MRRRGGDMRALIVDDEEPAREEMRWLLDQCSDVQIVGTAGDFDAAKEYLSDEDAPDPPDVVLLDIDMPGVNGVRVAEWLESAETEVVFVTAYEEYAIDAFGVDAVDYLLKPVRLERLQETLERVRRRLGERDAPRTHSESESEQQDDRPLRRLSVRPIETGKDEKESTDEGSTTAYRVVDLDDIQFLEAESGQVTVWTEAGAFLADFRLKDLEGRLDDENFFRCHRSYVVRLGAIDAIESIGDGRYRLVIDDDDERAVPLARSRASELKRRMPWSANVLDSTKRDE